MSMLRRLTGFSLLPLIGILTPFILLPVVARVGGAGGWAAIGVGQSVGIIGGVTTLWGWWILGPARMSHLKVPRTKHALYVESLQQRLIIFSVVAPVAGVVSSAFSDQPWALTAGLMAVAGCSAGLSPSWYSVGEGRPLQMVLFDELPKAAAMAAAAILVWWTRTIWFYPALLLISSTIPPIVFAWYLSRSAHRLRKPLAGVLRSIPAQAAVAGTNLLGTSYTATPVPVGSLLVTAPVLAPFVSAEKLYRLGTFTVKALGNAMQSWVLEGGVTRVKRQYAAVLAHLFLGILGGALLTGLGPTLTKVLFGREVAANYSECAAFGIAFLFVSLSTPLTRNILVPAGITRLPLAAAACGACIGLPSMIGLGLTIGISGLAIGLAISQALIFSILIIPAYRCLRRKSASVALGA